MRLKRSTRFDLCKKIFTRKMVIPRTWIRKEVVFFLWYKPQGEWDRVAESMTIRYGGSGHPVFRATSPLSRGTLKSKGGGQLSIHFCADGETIKTVFRTITSVNQLSIYGAVADVCEECKSCQARTGRPVLAGQSDPLFEPARLLMKTPTPSTGDLAQEDLLQKHQERVDKLSQQNRVIKICIDAGFPHNSWSRTVLHDKGHWRVLTILTCREYTLPRDEKSSDPKGWIRGNTKNCARVRSHNQLLAKGKYGAEIRIESVNNDNSHSWVRISHGIIKLVTILNNKDQDDNEQETSEMQFEEYALKLDAKDFACRSKAKTIPQKRYSASSTTRTIPIGERTLTDIEPQDYSPTDYSVSKKLINLLRHGCLPQDNDGAIEFWRIKDNLQKHFQLSRHWSDEKWKSSMAGGGGHKKWYQYCADSSGKIRYFRAIQSHSGRKLIDPSLQDTVVIPDGFLKYIFQAGCAINLHSIINSGLIPGGQNLSKRQRVFFSACESYG